MSGRLPPLALVVTTALATSACGRGVLDTRTPEAKHIALLWWVMFSLAGAVFIVVAALMLYALFRRDASSGAFAQSPRAQSHFIVIAGGIIPLIILVIVFGFTIGVMAASRPGDNGVPVHIVGHDFWWEAGYPGENATAHNEVHVPVGREIDFSLDSDDVIHSFWVPQLNGKIDLVPGQTNRMTITVTSPGVYRGECAEFCGIGHACMTFTVIAEPQPQFDAWLADLRRNPPRGDPQEFDGGDCTGRSAGAVERNEHDGPPSTAAAPPEPA